MQLFLNEFLNKKKNDLPSCTIAFKFMVHKYIYIIIYIDDLYSSIISLWITNKPNTATQNIIKL